MTPRQIAILSGKAICLFIHIVICVIFGPVVSLMCGAIVAFVGIVFLWEELRNVWDGFFFAILAVSLWGYWLMYYLVGYNEIKD